MAGNQQFDADGVRSALQRYQGPLLRYAARLTGDQDGARDVVQETFLRLCEARPADVDGHLAEWLYTVCRNGALNVRRKEKRMTPLSAAVAEGCVSPDAAPEAGMELREAADEVFVVLEGLPESQQEAIRLKFQSGLSYKEISRVTGHTVSNVGFLIHTGMKTLRSRLKSEPLT